VSPCHLRRGAVGARGYRLGVIENSVVELLAPAKLTLSLRVVGVRDDGYHLIEAEMVSVDLFDRLRVTPGEHGVVFGGPAAGRLAGESDGDDLVSAALRLARRSARVEVHKEVPAGAGLGGGSSDAAAILRWAGFDDLQAAAALGADVAFCLVGGRALVGGIGERVEALPAVERTVTLLTPPIHCSTPAVYRRWDELGGPVDPRDDGNDLTAAALDVAPELVRWRDVLGELSGLEPRLAGSGSTWFVEGAFEHEACRVVRTVGPVTGH
jgi:4-diphosphocytidyl-2-C-methyl-D-erythritol kinase